MSPAAPDPHSASLQPLFLEAVRVRKRGDAVRARGLFREILDRFPGTHEAWYMHAMLCIELGDRACGEEGLRRALALDAGNPEYLFRLGALVHQSGRYEEAAGLLEEAVESGEEYAPLLLALGRAHLAAANSREAERAFRRVLGLEPGHLESMLGLMASLEVRNKTEEALAIGAEAVVRWPSNAGARARLAALFERCGRLAEAESEAEAALRLDAGEPMALLVRGRLHHRAGRFEGAIADCRAALERRPSRAEEMMIRRTMGLALDRAGRYDEAFAAFAASKRTEDQWTPEMRGMLDGLERYIEACVRTVRVDSHRSWARPTAEGRESPVFFVGFPRSGTTLMEQLLAAHPGIVTTDEIPALTACTEALSDRFGGVARVPGRLGSLTVAEVDGLRDAYWRAIHESLPESVIGGRLVVDKLPLNTINLYTARLLFPESRVIVALRDPRDVVLSGFMNLASNALAVVGYRSLETASRFYAGVMRLWFHMRTTVGLPWIEVRYEDLVEDSEAVSKRVIGFLQRPWDDAVLDYLSRTRGARVRSASYQQVTERIHGRSLGRWRAYEEHFGSALETLQPYVEALGYGDR
jgi:tetratricopeptide (TPR) repeat protein